MSIEYDGDAISESEWAAAEREDEVCRMCNDYPCRCLYDDDPSDPMGDNAEASK